MLYVGNMRRWSHCKQQVREALDDADKAGFDVVDTSTRGHSWGYILCRVCGKRRSVWSTPKNADNHAKQIRRFIWKHHHS